MAQQLYLGQLSAEFGSPCKYNLLIISELYFTGRLFYIKKAQLSENCCLSDGSDIPAEQKKEMYQL